MSCTNPLAKGSHSDPLHRDSPHSHFKWAWIWISKCASAARFHIFFLSAAWTYRYSEMFLSSKSLPRQGQMHPKMSGIALLQQVLPGPSSVRKSGVRQDVWSQGKIFERAPSPRWRGVMYYLHLDLLLGLIRVWLRGSVTAANVCSRMKVNLWPLHRIRSTYEHGLNVKHKKCIVLCAWRRHLLCVTSSDSSGRTYSPCGAVLSTNRVMHMIIGNVSRLQGDVFEPIPN